MFSSDSLVVVTASNDGTARVCDAETGEHVAELKHGGIVYSAAFSPDNKSVVTTGADGTAQIWTKNSARRALFLARGSYGDLGPVSVKFDPVSAKSDPHSKKIVTTGTDGRIVFWDKTGAQERIAVKIPKRPNEDSEYRNLYDVTSDPNGRFVVTASWVERRPSGKNDQNAHVWKLEDQKLVSLPDLTGHEGPVTTVAYSPKGHYVLTASDDGTVLVWDTSTWKALPWRLDPHTVEGEEDAGLILDASFDPTEKYIATAQVNGTVHLWDVSTGKSVRVIKAHKGSVLSVAFNTEGDLIVTGSDDNTAQVRTTAGKKIFTLSGHTRPVIYAEFSNDGKFIVTTSLDGTVRVWEREKGALVTVFDEIIDTPRSADFSPDNQSIVIGGSLGAVSVFDCEVCRPLEEIRKLALEQNPRPLTEEEREQYTLEQGMEPKETIQQSK
jgi:WD40 repeat protein